MTHSPEFIIAIQETQTEILGNYETARTSSNYRISTGNELFAKSEPGIERKFHMRDKNSANGIYSKQEKVLNHTAGASQANRS